ncbi:uncharacterized protein [Paramormyrops kingsleyae]|uniref:uncharacterized protein n=1 Tax=Paramormyrops kingsleyae TaxID=1676925 RepID=UPI003B975574
MAPVIGLYYFLILTYSYLLNNGMIIASRVDPTFRLGGAIQKSVARDQNAEISGFGRLQMGRSSLVPPSAGNATNTIEAANGSLVYGHGYQSDQVLYEGAQERLQQERLQQLGLSVQCRHDGMSLKLKGNRVSHLLVDRDGAPPVPLSQLPSHCGFSVRRARRDVTLVAPYNGCHVTRQRGYYTLPLHVWGIPVMMSCPVSSSSSSPPTISCGSSSMVVMLEGAVAEELSVKVSGSWEPLLAVCGKCGYNVDQGPGQLRITVPFTTPCVGLMDSGPSLRLRSAGEEMTLVCPLTSTPTPATPLLYFPYYTITTPAPTTVPYPKIPAFYPWFPFSLKAPVTTVAPTARPPVYPLFAPYPIPYYPVTPKPPTTASKYQLYPKPFQFWYPMMGPTTPKPTTASKYQLYQNPFQFWYPMMGPTTPKPTPASKYQLYPNPFQFWYPMMGPTTPKPTPASKYQLYPNPIKFWYPMMGPTTPKPTTATSKYQLYQNPFQFWYPMMRPTTPQPTTATSKYQLYPNPYPFWYLKSPVIDPATPKPITAGCS